jgi:DNA-binding response OmpR family regulator
MQTQWLPHVATVLYDPVHANRHLTRNALFTLGFREIEAVTSLMELRRALEAGTADLCVIDVSAEEAEICQLIRDLRHGRLGANPFPVIIATSWRQSGDLVRRVIESGADDLILRPLSTGTLKSRIEQQIETRKSFVVTSTYIGPDRRRSSQRAEGQGLVDVPNSLRLKAKEGVLAGMPAAELAEIRQRVERIRLEKDAFHIGLACRLLTEHLQTPDASYDVDAELAGLGEAAQDLKTRAGGVNFVSLAPLCEGIEEAVRELKQSMKAEEAGTKSAKPLALITEFAKAVQLSLNASKDEAAFADEIGQTVERIKSRRAAIVEERTGVEAQRPIAAGAGAV